MHKTNKLGLLIRYLKVFKIKTHPTRKETKTVKNQNKTAIPTESNFQLNLYKKILEKAKNNPNDIISLSDIVVVFGSTVAINSSWINVPCITFEQREESLIYCVDNDKIKHAKSLQEFKNLIEINIKKEKSISAQRLTNVSDFILDNIKTKRTNIYKMNL